MLTGLQSLATQTEKIITIKLFSDAKESPGYFNQCTNAYYILCAEWEGERKGEKEREREMHYTMESMPFTLFSLEQHVVAFK